MPDDKPRLSQAALDFLAIQEFEQAVRAQKIESQQILRDMVNSGKIKLTPYRNKRKYKRASKAWMNKRGG